MAAMARPLCAAGEGVVSYSSWTSTGDADDARSEKFIDANIQGEGIAASEVKNTRGAARSE
jgi:hypothetical protein